MKDLLIINCSKSKYSDVEILPALERYNGVAFRVVRKFLQQKNADYIEEHLNIIGDYETWYQEHLDNTLYRPLIKELLEEIKLIQ